MPLPSIEIPSYELKLTTIEEKIPFRPFLVKEEKILLHAMEGDQNDMVNAMKQIISNCLLVELNVDELPLFDLEYLFLNLRSKSVGETAELLLTCQECEAQNPAEIDLGEVQIKFPPNEVSPNVMLTDEIGIVLKYPTVNILKFFSFDDDFNFDTTLDIIEHCVDIIFEGEELYDLNDYTKEERENFFQQMTQQQFGEIQNFFDNMPRLLHNVEFKCHACESDQLIVLEGLQNFFG